MALDAEEVMTKSPFTLADDSWRIYHRDIGELTARLLFEYREGHEPLEVREFGLWLYVGPIGVRRDQSTLTQTTSSPDRAAS